jgi:Lipid A 3-O-deacylase (PagL)
MLTRAVLVVCMLAASQAAAAQPWTIDAGTAVLPEAWDFNESREVLTGVTIGVARAVWRPLAVRVEGLLLNAAQQPRDAWTAGFTMGVQSRWRLRRGQPYADLAVGLSRAEAPVPQRGTRSNYVIVAGGGLMVAAGRGWVQVGARWLHLSNAGRVGKNRNPDVQAIGLTLGVVWPF